MKRLLIILSFCATATHGDVVSETRSILEFDRDDAVEWRTVNDGVMGGISRSAIRTTDEGTALFTGSLSLENNGGFASVRTGTGGLDLSAQTGFVLRVRGDGRTYQLRVRTDDRWDGAAYRAFFDTTEGEWTEHFVPFDAFEPTFRGRILAEAPPLDPARIRQLGFMLADRNPGDFALELDFLHAR